MHMKPCMDVAAMRLRPQYDSVGGDWWTKFVCIALVFNPLGLLAFSAVPFWFVSSTHACPSDFSSWLTMTGAAMLKSALNYANKSLLESSLCATLSLFKENVDSKVEPLAIGY